MARNTSMDERRKKLAALSFTEKIKILENCVTAVWLLLRPVRNLLKRRSSNNVSLTRSAVQYLINVRSEHKSLWSSGASE